MGNEFGAGRSGEEALEGIAAIARELAGAEDLDETLQLIVDLSLRYIAPCEGATMMLVRRGEVVTPAFSGADARAADIAQYRTGEGPCLTSMREQQTIVVDDIESDQRWPAWRDEVSQLGWGSMVGLRLFVAEDTMGALDIYSRRADAFDEHSKVLAQVFASHASVAMKAAIAESGLQRAIESRDVIGQAKGILMERERLSSEQAFARLREMSQANNVKLRELAREITETGELPDVGPAGGAARTEARDEGADAANGPSRPGVA